MEKWKNGIMGVLLCGSMLLSGCSVYAADRQGGSSLGAAEAAEYTMESLKELDLDRFNEYTDNHIATYRSWIGIPIENEYRVFNELLQPGVRIGKRKERYEFNRKLSEKIMENLSWEIEDVTVDGNQAKILMEISNLNMADVMGKYEIHILENMIAGAGTGIGQMIRDILSIRDEEGGLLAIVEACDKEDISTMNVTVTAYQANGAWKLHLDDAFINAFMGNIDAEEYSEEVQLRIESLTRQQEEKLRIESLTWLQEEKLDEWEDTFTDRVERWVENWAEGF